MAAGVAHGSNRSSWSLTHPRGTARASWQRRPRHTPAVDCLHSTELHWGAGSAHFSDWKLEAPEVWSVVAAPGSKPAFSYSSSNAPVCARAQASRNQHCEKKNSSNSHLNSLWAPHTPNIHQTQCTQAPCFGTRLLHSSFSLQGEGSSGGLTPQGVRQLHLPAGPRLSLTSCRKVPRGHLVHTQLGLAPHNAKESQGFCS